MIKHIKCNMFDSGADIFCHQVNCQGEMNTGVAAEVRKRYPWVFAEYKRICDNAKHLPHKAKSLLGATQFLFINETQQVANLYAQEFFGYDGKCYTDYKALKKCLSYIKKNFNGKTIAIPYKMGCHRGGGDWDIVYKLICDAFENSKCDVLICEYNGEVE